MKKLLTTILIIIISVMALTACSSGKLEGEEPDQPPVEIEVEDEVSEEDIVTLNDTYALSDLMFYDLDTEEWVTADFIPGAEKYVFHDDYTCE